MGYLFLGFKARKNYIFKVFIHANSDMIMIDFYLMSFLKIMKLN